MIISLQNKNVFLTRASTLLVILLVFSATVNAQTTKKKTKAVKVTGVVDATTIEGKIMAGYQGWFRTPGDRPGSRSWAHVFNGNGGGTTFTADRLALDTWPDMSEYSAGEKTVIPGWNFPDGSPATMYSAQNPKTVLRHFQWMKKYGIDGVWLSEFCGSFRNPARPDSSMLKIMYNVQAAARATGRTWAYMWDMTSFGSSSTKEAVYNSIIGQWKNMVDQGVTSDPRYLHDHGKPVLLIWGFFPERPASQPDHMNAVVDFLEAPGKYQCYLIGGATNNWRKGTPAFQAMMMRMQGLQPWTVGRRIKNLKTGYWMPFTGEWAEDIAMCKAHGVKFMPVINSGTHIAGPPPTPPALPYVPRRMGNYLWQQFKTASKTGVINSAFVAMFDEVNEGTEILKVTNKPPVQAQFLTFDGATSDYYLRLVGEGAKYLRSGQPMPPSIPISPFDAKKWYKLKNNATGLMLADQGKTAKNPLIQAADAAGKGEEWQLIYLYDGNPYFKIKSRLTGKVLSRAADDSIIQTADVPSDYAKWHLEFDGTGSCRIINKVSGKALSSNGSTNANSPVVQVPDPKAPDDLLTRDDLRWKVVEE